MSVPRMGDERFQRNSGLAELLSAFHSIKIVDDAFSAALSPQQAWDSLKNMYLIAALPLEVKAELRGELVALFERAAQPSGVVQLEFPMRRFVAYK